MIKPNESRLVVKPHPEETEKSGILIAKAGRQKPNKGVVVASAKDNKIKRGANVLYPPFAGHEIEWEGETYIIFKQEEILGTY